MKERCSIFSLCKEPQKLAQIVLVAAFLLGSCFTAMAQSGIRITGVVTSGTDGDVLIGVNVVQKGTTNGTITDFDGNFELTVPAGAEIEVSYIGFLNQTITVREGQTSYNVVLREDSQALDEVVVVGYGVQKKKLVTGATVQVKGDDLQKLSTTSALGALQSQSPGVNITQQSGQPGEGFKVTVRGLGTVGSSSPLYVIDGVAGGDINILNPSDIESIDVLKDAASAAIYGARAANGVILVTTKQGKAGKMQISYDGYVGWQYMYRKPDMLNAREYMTILDEVRFNEGNSGYDWQNLLPTSLYNSVMDGSWNGTDWIDEIYNKAAPTHNHAVNLSGGNEMSKFSLGFSYTSQEGILGKPTQSEYERYTARINSDHVVLKVKDYDVIKIGQTMNYGYSEKGGIAIGNIYWNNIFSALTASPLLPAYNSEGGYYDYYDKVNDGWNLDGNTGNPIAAMALSSQGLNRSKNYNLQTSAYVEIQPIKHLVFRSQFGYKMSGSSYRSADMIRRLDNNTNVTQETVSQNQSIGHNWTLDNTLSYRWTKDAHAADIVIGQSVEKWGMGESVNAEGKNNIFLSSWDHAWVDNTQPTNLSEIGAGGSPWDSGSLASFFGRINYNYRETYMASVVLRADGSSSFARGNRWGYFPSVSAGWVVTNEAFMENVQNWMDFLKIRASWGQNGNCNIAAFQYLSTFAFDSSNQYYFGTDKQTPSTGGYMDILQNPNVTWETSEQLDLGIDARFLNSRLGFVFDWYKRTTKDWLVQAPILATYGLTAPYINGGDVVNKGVEIVFTWDDQIGRDFTYGVNVNMAYNKNEVTRIANAEGIIHGASNVLSQGTTEMYRAQEGYPIGYFYGYKTEGVFQNWAQIEEYRNAGKGVYDGAQPGDLIFADTNGDGYITEEDRTMIGNPHPKVTMGLSLNFGYKGFDLSLTATGAFGHQIAKSYRSFADSQYQNYTTDIFGRWTGEGTSNKLPRLTSGSHVNWQNISDIYIENGDYVKLQNLTVGYDFKKLFPNMPLGQARLYFTAQNLFTITGYSGMDPEIGYGYDQDWVSGIDLGFYPSPRTYLVGVNLKF